MGIVAEIPLVGPLLGLSCTPITVIGVGSGANCAQQTVCCQNTQFVSRPYAAEVELSPDVFAKNGLVNVGCTNVNLGL